MFKKIISQVLNNLLTFQKINFISQLRKNNTITIKYTNHFNSFVIYFEINYNKYLELNKFIIYIKL